MRSICLIVLFSASLVGGSVCFAETRDELLDRCLEVEPGADQRRGDESCARLVREGIAEAHWIANELHERARVTNEKGHDVAWASAVYQRAIRYHPGDATLYFWASIVAGTGSKYDEAVDLLTKAIGLDPNYADAYSMRGGLYQFRYGDMERALRDYTAAVRASSAPIHLISRGEAYLTIGEHDLAFADFDAAAAAAPTSARYRQWSCMERAQTGLELERGRLECETVLRLSSSEWPTALYSLGLIALREGHISAALSYFERALAANDNALYRYARGVALRRLGRTVEGDADIAAAAREWPEVEARFARFGIAME